MDYKASLENLLETVIREGGSDLHLSVGNHPIIRVDDVLIPLQSHSELTASDTLGFIGHFLLQEQKENFLKSKEVDFSYNHKNKARFRGNGFFQQGKISIALRLIPGVIKTLEELNLPPILESFTQRKQGFFLVVGPVGQGKTTTLAAMIELINNERSEPIVTIEDPIEFMYKNTTAIIPQQ